MEKGCIYTENWLQNIYMENRVNQYTIQSGNGVNLCENQLKQCENRFDLYRKQGKSTYKSG